MSMSEDGRHPMADSSIDVTEWRHETAALNNHGSDDAKEVVRHVAWSRSLELRTSRSGKKAHRLHSWTTPGLIVW
jgi:hypothetical protein